MSYICAMDLGGYQFKLITASINDSGEMEILSATKKKTESIRDGKVIDSQAATDALRDAFEEVSNLAGVKGSEIKHFVCNVTGSHIRGYEGTLNNMISIDHSNSRINEDDIAKVVKNCKAEGLYEDSEIIHKIPRHFTIDNTSFIQHPCGLEGQKLSVNAYIVATSMYQMNNLRNVITDALGVKKVTFVLNSLASAEAILTDEHKEMGVILVDLGGETVDIAAYTKRSLLFAASFSGCGKDITLDLAKQYSLSTGMAQKLKEDFSKIISLGKTTIPVEALGGMEREVRVPSIKRDIQEKFNAIFGNVYNKVQYYMDQEGFAAGIVLTGGTSMTHDILATASSHFHVMTQLGKLEHPIPGIGNIDYSPEFATTLGLLLWERKRIMEGSSTKKKGKFKPKNIWEWITGLFSNLNED